MDKRAIVSIYEVDEWGTTGPWVGQGSLVERGLVLVHPPLSDQITAGKGPQRLRVGIFEPAELRVYPGDFVEIIDVWGQPHVMRGTGSTETVTVVGLELRVKARAAVSMVPGVGLGTPRDEALHLTAEYLQEVSKGDWSPPVEHKAAPWCMWFGWGC